MAARADGCEIGFVVVHLVHVDVVNMKQELAAVVTALEALVIIPLFDEVLEALCELAAVGLVVLCRSIHCATVDVERTVDAAIELAELCSCLGAHNFSFVRLGSSFELALITARHSVVGAAFNFSCLLHLEVFSAVIAYPDSDFAAAIAG